MPSGLKTVWNDLEITIKALTPAVAPSISFERVNNESAIRSDGESGDRAFWFLVEDGAELFAYGDAVHVTRYNFNLFLRIGDEGPDWQTANDRILDEALQVRNAVNEQTTWTDTSILWVNVLPYETERQPNGWVVTSPIEAEIDES